MPRPLALIGVPSSAGAYSPGQEKAPRALREAGLAAGLEAAGFTVRDDGDAPVWRWRPDRENRFAMNLDEVAACAGRTAGRVQSALAENEFALVLGGDCTVGVGTVAGHLAGGGKTGLVYLDMHSDLNTPGSVPDGALDWMGVAHMLGIEGTAAALRDIGERTPLLEADQLVMLAHDAQAATTHELAVIERRGLATVQLAAVAADPAAAARAALSSLSSCDRLAVHFDVDTIDFADAPLSENTARNVGLRQDDAFAALTEVLRDPRVDALTVTELNPDHGSEDGSTLRAFAERLVAALA